MSGIDTCQIRRSGLIHDSSIVAPDAWGDTLRLPYANGDKSRGSRIIQSTVKGVTFQLKSIDRLSVTCEGCSIQNAKGSSFTVTWISWHDVLEAGPRAEPKHG